MVFGPNENFGLKPGEFDDSYHGLKTVAIHATLDDDAGGETDHLGFGISDLGFRVTSVQL